MARLSPTRGILAAFLLLLGVRAESATVIGSIQDSFATAYGGQVRTIQFDPLSAPQGIGTNTIWPKVVTARITNGVFTANLVGGLYWAGLLGDDPVTGGPRKTVKVLVPPNDTNTYTLNEVANLATNLGTFAYTNRYYSYIGDGAGITNLQSSNIVGIVSGGITNGQDGVTLANPNFTGIISIGGAVQMQAGDGDELVVLNPLIANSFTGNGSAITNLQAGNIVGLDSVTGVDAGSVPAEERLRFPIGGGLYARATVHPNALWLPTNWNGSQVWLAFTGTTNQTATAFGTDTEDPFVYASSDGGNSWTLKSAAPLQTKADSQTVAQWSSSGWQADPELYLDTNGVMRLLWMGFHPYVGSFSNVLFTSHSTDGATWSTPMVLRKWATDAGNAWSTNAAMAGPQIVATPQGLRLYYVDDGNYGLNPSGVGTNSLWYVSALDGSGTNWDWTTATRCTLSPYLTNNVTPWHFDIALVGSNRWYLQYGSQASSFGEYSTSTNGVNWSAPGMGLFLSTDLKQRPEEYGFYKATWSAVPGANVPTFAAILGHTPLGQTNVDGWNFSLARSLVPDPLGLVYTGVNTNGLLVGGNALYGGVGRLGALTVVDNFHGSSSGKVALGQPFNGWGGIAIGYNAPMAATNYVLASDGLTETRLNARAGAVNTAIGNAVKATVTSSNASFAVPVAFDDLITIVAATNSGSLYNSGAIQGYGGFTLHGGNLNAENSDATFASVTAGTLTGDELSVSNITASGVISGDGSGLTHLNVADASGESVPVPAGFRWTNTVAIYRKGNYFWPSVTPAIGNVARSATQYVLTNGNDAADGISWATAKASLSNAMNGVATSLAVYLGPGAYPLTPPLAFSNSLSLICTGGVASVPRVSVYQSSVYASGMRFLGFGGTAFTWFETVSGTNSAAFDKCNFTLAATDGLYVVANAGLCLVRDCQAATNGNDGFGYQGSVTNSSLCVLEERCVGAWNGTNNSLSNNGSTVHDNVTAVRIGGSYYRNEGRNVADIGYGGSWNINCQSGGSRISGSDADTGFACGSGADTTLMVLDGCGALFGSPLTYLAGSNGVFQINGASPNDGMLYTKTDIITSGYMRSTNGTTSAGPIVSFSTADATSYTSGAMRTAGGISAEKSAWFQGRVFTGAGLVVRSNTLASAATYGPNSVVVANIANALTVLAVDGTTNVVPSNLNASGTITASNIVASAGGRGGLAINGVTNVQDFGAAYTAITNWTTAKTVARIGLSTSAGTMTITNAGTYWVHFQTACAGAGTAAVEVALHQSGVEDTTLETSRTFSTSRGSMSFGGHLTTTTNNAVIDVRIKALSGTETISFFAAQFSAHRILD